MLNYQFFQKVKCLVGPGCVNQLGELAKEMGYKKALIVTDPGIVKTGIADKVKAGLENGGVEVVVFDENTPNPQISASKKAYEMFNKEGCDFVVGVGGGGSLDCAKGVQILRFNEGDIMQYANFAKPFDVGSGLVLIPTTAGTGSEMSDGAILSDENHIKFNFIAPCVFADYAVLDPELSAGMPPKLTAYTGLDAFTHCVEGYTGNATNDFVQFIAMAAMRTIVEYLPRAVADGNDMEARAKMAIASNIGGFLLPSAHTNAGHSIGQTVGGRFDIPHGAACAYAEPWVLEWNAPACPELTKNVAELLGAKFDGSETPEQIGAKCRDAFIDFRDNKCKLPSIKEYKYDESQFDELAEICVGEVFQNFNARGIMNHDENLWAIKKMYE